MASGNLATKRKSSHSSSSLHKKKLSKKSAEVKKRKRSKSRKRDKSKKLRREGSLSISSSDLEDGNTGRKGRSRTRGDVKGSKKRVKRSPSSSSGDSRDPPSSKKRKRSKRTDGSKLKKKSRHGKSHKKGSKRDVSVDSISSDSRSCSTSRGWISGEESEIKRSRGRSKGRDKGQKSLDQISDGRDRYNYRSRSCSPCNKDNEQSHYYNEGKLVCENYSRGLRSVVTVPNEYEEGIYQSKDGNKAEIIQAYDDCPSCKSNDSYDGGRTKESSHQAQAVFEKKRQVHDAMVEDEGRNESSHQMSIPEKLKILNSKVESTIKKNKIPVGSKTDDGIQCGEVDHTENMEATKMENKGEVSGGVVSSEVGDLEFILRQKALENFQKFRKERQTQTVPPEQRGGADVGVKQPSIAKDEPIKSSKDTDISVVGASNIVVLEKKSVGSTIVKGVSITNLPKDDVRNSDGISKRPESFHTMHAGHPSVGDRNIPFDTNGTEKKIISSGAIHNSSKRSFVYRRESPGDQSIKQASNPQDFPDGKSQQTTYFPRKNVSQPPKPVVGTSGPREIKKTPGSSPSQETNISAKKIVPEAPKASMGNSDPHETNKASESVTFQETKSMPIKIVPEPPKAAVGSSHPHEINKAPESVPLEATSYPTPVNEEHGSTESNAVKGGSEFEQKTMSVMRGNEMVQVSYKVYIPKKTPALARRQLRR